MAVGIIEVAKRKWHEENPGKDFPQVGSVQFFDYINKTIESETIAAQLKEDAKKIDHEYDKYTNVEYYNFDISEEENNTTDKNAIFETLNDFAYNHPVATVGLLGTLGLTVFYKIIQQFYAGAIYKGNLKTLKYIWKHQ